MASVVDSAKHKFLISDTTLWSFIPPQVRKMTPRLHQICVCEFCIIPKDIQIDLNRFSTNIVTHLQNKSIGRHTRKSAYILPHVMKITSIKCFQVVNVYILLSNMHLSAYPVLLLNQIMLLILSVIWVFYDECPECIITDEEIYDGPNSPLIKFSVYTRKMCQTWYTSKWTNIMHTM